MTNLTAISVIILSTNWTGIVVEKKELGYITTNTQAIVCFDGLTNRFELKKELGSVALWRDEVKPVDWTKAWGGLWLPPGVSNIMIYSNMFYTVPEP